MLLRRQAVLIALAAVVRRHHIAGEALVDMLITRQRVPRMHPEPAWLHSHQAPGQGHDLQH